MTDPTNDYRVTNAPPCEGCGDHHGGPTAEILCLRQWLRSSRRSESEARAVLGHREREIVELKEELAPIRKLRADVSVLGASWPPDRK